MTTLVVPKHFDWLPCSPPDLGLPLSSSPNIKEQKLLVLWGMDWTADPIGDAWILKISSLTWEKVEIGGRERERERERERRHLFFPTAVSSSRYQGKNMALY